MKRNWTYGGKHTTVETGQLGNLVCTDLSGPHTLDNFGYKCILVLVKASTRFLIAEPLKTKQPRDVARAFVNRYIPIFGVPCKILSDQGAEYHNNLFKKLYKFPAHKSQLQSLG